MLGNNVLSKPPPKAISNTFLWALSKDSWSGKLLKYSSGVNPSLLILLLALFIKTLLLLVLDLFISLFINWSLLL